MIVRDEAAALPRCLASLRGLDAELCVVDTGSTDDTVAIAEAHGARVARFAWNDDFAAARNASLELASGAWILVLDADEELDPATIPALRAATAAPDATAWLVEVDNLLPGGRSQPALLPRLFRNRPDVRFCRAIHESVMESLRALGADTLRPSGVRIVHHGYLPEMVRARDKRTRNLALLRAEVSRTPDDLYALHKLAATLDPVAEREERRNVLESAARAACALSATEARERPFLPLVLAAAADVRISDGRLTDARSLLDAGLAVFPASPELAFGRGDVARRSGEAHDAVERLDACRGLPAPTLYPSDARLRAARPCMAIARTALAVGDLALAAAALDEAAAGEPPDAEARALSARLRLLTGDVAAGMAAADALLAELPAHPAVTALAGWLAMQAGDHATAEPLLRAVGPDGPDAGEAWAWRVVAALSSHGPAGAAALEQQPPQDLASAGAEVLHALARGVAPALDPAFARDAVARAAGALLRSIDGPGAEAARAAVAAAARATDWAIER